MELAPPIRPATRQDAAALAEFVNMAGEGLPLYLWTGMAAASEDPWEVGRRRVGYEEVAARRMVKALGECRAELAAARQAGLSRSPRSAGSRYLPGQAPLALPRHGRFQSSTPRVIRGGRPCGRRQ